MTLSEGYAFLSQLDLVGLILLCWHMVLFELPRYLIGFVILSGNAIFARPRAGPPEWQRPRSISVILACHNEVGGIERAVRSLREQVFETGDVSLEIVVVDDGSSDGTPVLAERLRDRGFVDQVIGTRIRGGKPSAVNLGIGYARGEIVVIADADTTFDRHAMDRLIAAFDAPDIGLVSGNIAVRNAKESLVTRIQAIEYAISISLGRRVGELFGLLTVVSGAFGGFRAEALHMVGGYDADVGEDADLTLKLRRAGWRVAFAPDAWAATDVPVTLDRLIAQRMRWNRSVITLWFRKFRGALVPRGANFRIQDALATLDILVYQIVLSVTFVIYLAWLFWTLGAFALVVLAATTIVYWGIATASYLLAALSSQPYAPLGLILYAPLWTMANAWILRFVRLVAYFDELVNRRSYRDPYLPSKVGGRIKPY